MACLSVGRAPCCRWIVPAFGINPSGLMTKRNEKRSSVFQKNAGSLVIATLTSCCNAKASTWAIRSWGDLYWREASSAPRGWPHTCSRYTTCQGANQRWSLDFVSDNYCRWKAVSRFGGCRWFQLKEYSAHSRYVNFRFERDTRNRMHFFLYIKIRLVDLSVPNEIKYADTKCKEWTWRIVEINRVWICNDQNQGCQRKG